MNATTAPATAEQQARHALWLMTEFYVNRYLMANAHGRRDGAEKAEQHQNLCERFIAVYFCVSRDDVRMEYEAQYQDVHTATQDALTDRLDEVIGFPLDSRPDYDTLAPVFFDVFHDTAWRTLAVGPQEPRR